MSDRCPCGGIILADTEDWAVPLCYNCYPKDIVEPLERKLAIAVEALKKMGPSHTPLCSTVGCYSKCLSKLRTEALAEIQGEE